MNEYHGRVPHNDEETGLLLTERPPGWEYMLLAGSLEQGVRQLEPQYKDYRVGYAPRSGVIINPANFEHFIDSEVAELQVMIGHFDLVIGENFIGDAVGPAGVAGDPNTIIHAATRVLRLYQDLLAWAERVRGFAMPSSYRAVVDALVRLPEQPIDEFRDFVARLTVKVDEIPGLLARNERIVINETVRFTLPDGLTSAFVSAYREVKKRL